MGRHLTLLAALFLVPMLALAGCSRAGDAPPAAMPTPASAPDDTVPLPPRAEELAGFDPVRAGIYRLQAAVSYRAQVVVETGAGERLTGSFDYVAPDRYHLVLDGGVPLEVITIGRASYVKAGGVWQHAEPSFLPFSHRDVLDQLARYKDAASAPAGHDLIDGLHCDVYTVATAALPWARFCVATDGPLLGASFKDGSTTVTVTFSGFGAEIEIRAPL